MVIDNLRSGTLDALTDKGLCPVCELEQIVEELWLANPHISRDLFDSDDDA